MRPFYVVKLIVPHGMTKTKTFATLKEARLYHQRLLRIHGSDAVPKIARIPDVKRDGPRAKG